MKISVVTNIGKVRARNEDSYLVDSARGIFAVCDGMGGHLAGDVASSLAVNIIHDWLKQHSLYGSINPVEGALQEANKAVWEAAQTDPDLRDMGTTATAALLWGNQLFIGHVGDSGIFLMRGQQIEKLSQDHTLAEQMVSKGLLTVEEARYSSYNHILTRAIGVAAEVQVDSCQLPVAAGDLIMICSDGLSDLLTAAEILAICQQYRADLDQIAQEMVQEALARGGYDNITLILLLID